MSRLPRSAAAGLLTVVLCLGMSTGPVQANGQQHGFRVSARPPLVAAPTSVGPKPPAWTAAHRSVAATRLRIPLHGPRPPAGAPQELAATGTGVTRPALSGLLTLLIGAGLVLIARQGPNGPGSRRT